LSKDHICARELRSIPARISAGDVKEVASMTGHTDPTHTSKKLRLIGTLALTSAIMFVEAFGGYASGSLALLADAGHMLTDVLALLVAFGAVSLGALPADERRTYGYRRLEILAALVNGVALVVISASIVYEAVWRWLNPHPVETRLMALIAMLCLLGNVGGLLLLRHERANLNIRAAFLHILADTLSSVGVLAAAGAMSLTGWTRLDAVVSVLIALLIIVSSVSLLREVMEVLLEAVPRGLDTEKIRRSIGTVEGVDEVHDLHVWSITTGLAALSAHVVVGDASIDPYRVLSVVQERLRTEYAIDHATLQVEAKAKTGCGCC
jgi:cobalt-zinc-cadmium efflux system protein